MWEQLQQRIQLRLDQMRKHPELILLYSLAFVGYILTMKEANKQLGVIGILAVVAGTALIPYLVARLRGARSIELPDEKDDGAAPLGFLRSSAEDDRPYLVCVSRHRRRLPMMSSARRRTSFRATRSIRRRI